MYKSKKKIHIFRYVSDTYVMKCHHCKIETKYIAAHIAKSKECQQPIDPKEFKAQFKHYKLRYKDQETIKENQRKWKAASRAKLRNHNNEKVKENQTKQIVGQN